MLSRAVVGEADQGCHLDVAPPPLPGTARPAVCAEPHARFGTHWGLAAPGPRAGRQEHRGLRTGFGAARLACAMPLRWRPGAERYSAPVPAARRCAGVGLGSVPSESPQRPAPDVFFPTHQPTMLPRRGLRPAQFTSCASRQVSHNRAIGPRKVRNPVLERQRATTAAGRANLAIPTVLFAPSDAALWPCTSDTFLYCSS